MANPNDEIRDKILRHLYEVHRKARGPKSVAIGIRDLQKALKESGVKQTDVNSNLDYLIQKGWAAQVTESRSFTTKQGTTQNSEKVTYKISDVGIDHLEGASTYHRQESFSRINITNVQGVTVVGSAGNIVNTQSTDLSQLLAELEVTLQNSSDLSDENRLNAVADIGTIQSQLAKPSPDRTIIERAWDGVSKVAAVGGATQVGAKILELIQALPV